MNRSSALFLLVLAGLSGTAHAESDFGEFLLDTALVMGPATRHQRYPQAAFDGENRLVVWEDTRTGHISIYGARVTPEGVLLDSGGIEVNSQPGGYAPAVAYNGTTYLVAWNCYSASDSSHDLYATRVTRDGVPLDPEGMVISSAPGNQSEATVASDGTGWLIAWQDQRADYDIYATRVTAAGEVLEPDGIPVRVGSSNDYVPAATFDGANYLVAWQGGPGIQAARIAATGGLVDSIPIDVCAAPDAQKNPSIASSGSGSFVVWGDYRSTGIDIYGARLAQTGTVLDTSGVQVCAAGENQSYPQVAWHDGRYLVAWHDQRDGHDIYAARVSADGLLLDSFAFVVSAALDDQRYPGVAAGGDAFMCVWQDDRGNSYDVYAARVTTLGHVVDTAGVLVSLSGNRQNSPAAVWDGTNYFAAWDEDRGDGDRVYGTRVTPSGTVLDPAGIAVCSHAASQTTPVVAYNGESFLVVWVDGRGDYGDIYGARVSPSGVVLDPDGFAVTDAWYEQIAPQVAAGQSGECLVTWEDWRNDEDADVFAARVARSGQVLDPDGIAACASTEDQLAPKVAAKGMQWFIVWEDWRLDDYTATFGARLNNSGVVLDSGGFQLHADSIDQWAPAVTAGALNYFVAWDDDRDTGGIVGTRVTVQGEVLDPDGIVVSAGQEYDDGCVTAFDGSNYCIVWAGVRDPNGYDICGARVSPSGVKRDEFTVLAAPRDQYPYGLVGDGSGQMLLVFTGYAGTVGGKRYDASRCWGKLGQLPGIEEFGSPPRNVAWPTATIVRGVLRLPVSPFTIRTSLFDMTGRQVMALHSGPNDVSRLSPGVFFVRAESERGPTTIKVAITR